MFNALQRGYTYCPNTKKNYKLLIVNANSSYPKTSLFYCKQCIDANIPMMLVTTAVHRHDDVKRVKYNHFVIKTAFI